MATPETECLLNATYWFRPILSELIGAATETANVNRDRDPSGPVKVVVTNQPHSRPNAGIDLVSGVSALAWFPASWASKVAQWTRRQGSQDSQKANKRIQGQINQANKRIQGQINLKCDGREEITVAGVCVCDVGAGSP